MNFFPRELCEHLAAMGCKSESGFYYKTFENGKIMPGFGICFSGVGCKQHPPAFSQNDFTGCHSQARENAKIVWGNGAVCDKCGRWMSQPCPWDRNGTHQGDFIGAMKYHRHKMIDAPDAAKYLEETIG